MYMIISSIYKIVNTLNGKVYIGISINFANRQKRHQYQSFNQNSSSYNTKLSRAFRKYGWNNFNWEIIYQSKDYDHIKSMEGFFIENFNSLNEGYNMTLGGEGTKGHKLTKDHKNKLSLTNIGKKESTETKKKKSLIKIGNQNSAKEWIVENPQGIKFKIKNRDKFFKDQGINTKSMWRVFQGLQNNYKGWKCKPA